MPRADVFEVSQWGPEVTPGTEVARTRRLLGTSLKLGIKSEHTTARAKGSRMKTTGVQNKEWTEGSLEMEVAQFTDLSYILAGLLGPPSISNPSSGVYLHEWDPLNYTALNPKTWSWETGSYVRAMKAAYGLITGFGMEFTRDSVSGSGSAIAQKVTDGSTLTAGTNEVQTLTASGTVSGGTYTLAFMGEITSALAYNASNATILAALNALPNVVSGDITLGGGALPGTPVTFTFAQQYASGNVPMIVVDGTLLTGSTPAYTMTQTTPGAGLTEVPEEPIAGNMWDFYLNTSAATLGNTKLTGCYSCGWEMSEMYGPNWVGNTSNTSFKDHVDLPPSTSFKFKHEAESVGMGFLTQLRAGDLVFPRIKCTGPTLGASTYLAQFDFAVQLTDISPLEDQDGVIAVEYTGEIFYDRTWGQYLSFDVRNQISAIA